MRGACGWGGAGALDGPVGEVGGGAVRAPRPLGGIGNRSRNNQESVPE